MCVGKSGVCVCVCVCVCVGGGGGGGGGGVREWMQQAGGQYRLFSELLNSCLQPLDYN